MEINEHQRRLFEDMITLIDSYLNEKSEDFYGIVGKLEGALDASEIKDPIFVDQWYNFWTPLEIWRAVHGSKVSKACVERDLLKMKEFLLGSLRDL